MVELKLEVEVQEILHGDGGFLGLWVCGVGGGWGEWKGGWRKGE